MLQSGISGRIVRNSIANLLRGVIALPIVLLITPFIISKIGTTAFGIWALASAFVSYANLLDLGIGAALVKLVAEHKAKGKIVEINHLLNTAFVVYVFIGALALSLLLLSKEWILAQFFRVGGELRGEVNFVLVGSALVFTLSLVFGGFSSLLNGLQRMDLTNGATIAGIIVGAVGTVVVLNWGYGLKGLEGLVVVSAAETLTSIAINAIMSTKEFPFLVFNPFLFRLSYARTLLSFSLQMHITGLATLVHTQLNKIVLSYFLGLEYVAYYEVASRVINQLKAFPLMMLSPIMPAASEIHVDQDQRKLQDLYYRSLKYMILTSLPVFTFVGVFAHPLINLWLGPGYEMAALALRFLTIAVFVNLLTAPSFFVLVGMGKPRYGVYSSVLGIVLNVILGVSFVAWIGYTGGILGTSLALVLASIYFIIIFHRSQQIPFNATMVRAMGYPTFICLILGGLASMLPINLLDNIGVIVLLGFIYGLIYLLAIAKSPYLDRHDLGRLHRYASKLYCLSSVWRRIDV